MGYKIYCHTNKINGKKYIGQTNQSLKDRWGENGKRYKGQVFYLAIKKYGWDNFEHELLFDNLSQEEANQKEIELIKLYNTTDKNYGYNITEGGHSNTLTEAQKEKRRQLNYQMWEDGTFKAIINTPVYCVELNKDFESALDAERKTGIDNSTIQKTCKKQRSYAGLSPTGQPLHWLYLNEKNETIIQELYNKKENIKGVNIPIYCLELDEIFYSTKEIKDKYGFDPSSIRKVVKGTLQTCGKHPTTGYPLHWFERRDLIQSKNKVSLEIWENLMGK